MKAKKQREAAVGCRSRAKNKVYGMDQWIKRKKKSPFFSRKRALFTKRYPEINITAPPVNASASTSEHSDTCVKWLCFYFYATD
jgi:hypothetical protein